MARSMENILLAFSEKYEGDFHRIYEAISTKEQISDNEIDSYVDDIEEDNITIISAGYPQSLKETYCPPFALFYEGNLNIVEDDISCVENPYDSSKRVFFGIEPCSEGLDYFIGTENREDLQPMLEYLIDRHPEFRFKDYTDKGEKELCA